jgi:hypothetical protein
MFSIVSTGGHTAYNLQHFVIDTAAEIADLPIDAHVGSTVFIVENSKYYMLNNKKEWVRVLLGSGIASDSTLVYDGGDLPSGDASYDGGELI